MGVACAGGKEGRFAEAVINDLAEGRRPTAMQPDESIVYDFVTDLLTTHAVRDEVFAKAKAAFGEHRLSILSA